MAYIQMKSTTVLEMCRKKIKEIEEKRAQKLKDAIAEKKKAFPWRFFNISDERAIAILKSNPRWISEYDSIMYLQFGQQVNTLGRLEKTVQLALNSAVGPIPPLVHISDEEIRYLG